MRRLSVMRIGMRDTGIGRAAGFRDDAELIAYDRAERAELERTLTPEALARLDSAEREVERRLLFDS